MMTLSMKNTIAGLVMLTTSVAAPLATAGVESDEPIKIAINEWTGQHLSANIAAELLKKIGYTVELVTAGGLPQFTALKQGDLHLNPEVWDNSVTDTYTSGLASGAIVDMGKLGLQPREGWIYPEYMTELCPGLPNYQALYDCAQAFTTAETFPNGRLITYPADWGTRSVSVVKTTNLPFNAIPGGSEGAMIAELKSALASKEPILMMLWQPHWIFSEVDMKWVEWDRVDPQCAEEEQQRGSACGFAQASVNKIVSKSLSETWPGAARLVKNMKLTNDDQNAMIYEVDQAGRSLDEVVAEWINANEDKWSTWTE
ncbi:MAG: glycine betaine/proline transport system substrate-binding protein [Gammaproteobacteria bacterium]|jgi:glycine betaine/proline transport system substrate-binding protein